MKYAARTMRLGSLALFALSLGLVPAFSSAPSCVIYTDCPLGQYCTNPPVGSGGVCQTVGSGGDHDTGPRIDAGATDGGARDTGPRSDTGTTPDTGAAADTGASQDDAGDDAGT